VRAARAPLRKKVLGPIPPPENSLGIHSDPCAYTGIFFGLSGPKVTVQIVRSSSGLRCATAAVPFADNSQSKAVRRRVDGRDGISTYRGTFDDTVQSFVEPRTEPQRTGNRTPNELRTIAASLLVSLPQQQMPMHAHG
jgi:hypothetical protein